MSSDIRPELVSVMRELEAMSLSCAGPRGRLKILMVGPEGSLGAQMVLTSCSRKLIEHSAVISSSPLAHVLIELTRQQHVQCGDGGLFVLAFAASLTRAALSSGIHCHHMSNAYSTAMVSDD